MTEYIKRRGDSMRPRKHQNMKVRVFYPETDEGMEELQESQSKAVLHILENKLGEEGLSIFIEYAKKKLNYKQ